MKERVTIWLSHLLPRRLAYWAFIRVATEGCEGNPCEQSCYEPAKRWTSGVN